MISDVPTSGVGRPQRSTNARAAYRALKRMIVTTELPPGARLNESELMKALHVGRTPLRDALRSLAEEGLVEVAPRHATFVSRITVQDLSQVFEVRLAIEKVVAEAAIRHLDKSATDAARSLLERARTDTTDASDVEIDQEMHGLLLRATQNRFLQDFYGRVGTASLRLLYLTRCGMESRQMQISTLEQVCAALEARSLSELSEILTGHVVDFRDRVRGAILSSDFDLPAARSSHGVSE